MQYGGVGKTPRPVRMSIERYANLQDTEQSGELLVFRLIWIKLEALWGGDVYCYEVYRTMQSKKKKRRCVACLLQLRILELNKSSSELFGHRGKWISKHWATLERPLSVRLLFFDLSPVPNEFVEQLDKSLNTDTVAFLEFVQVELGKQASLIEKSKYLFEIHLLIYDFIVADDHEGHESIICEGCNGLSVHRPSASVGESILDPPYACNKALRYFLPHFKSVLNNWRTTPFRSTAPWTQVSTFWNFFSFSYEQKYISDELWEYPFMWSLLPVTCSSTCKWHR